MAASFQYRFKFLCDSVISNVLSDLSSFTNKHVDEAHYKLIKQFLDQALSIAKSLGESDRLRKKSFGTHLNDFRKLFDRYYNSGLRDKESLYTELQKKKTDLFELYDAETYYLQRILDWNNTLPQFLNLEDQKLKDLHSTAAELAKFEAFRNLKSGLSQFK